MSDFPAIGERFGVTSLPALIVFHDGGTGEEAVRREEQAADGPRPRRGGGGRRAAGRRLGARLIKIISKLYGDQYLRTIVEMKSGWQGNQTYICTYDHMIRFDSHHLASR